MKYKIIKLNTARNCLRYVIRAFNISELYVPYYLCPAVRSSVFKENCKIKFYHIDTNFNPAEEFPFEAYILYPDYFGICADTVDKLSKKYKNLIIDNAHAFFSKPRGIASFNSVRKFFPSLRNGAFLYTTKTLDIDIKQDKYFYNPGILSFEDICKNENKLDYEDIMYMSECTFKYFSNQDLKTEKQKKLEAFYYYHKQFASQNKLQITLKDNQVPYKYPYLAADKTEADAVVNRCSRDNITVYRYWHNLPDGFDEKVFFTSLVAL